MAVFDDRGRPASKSGSESDVVIDLRGANAWADAAEKIARELRFPSPWGRSADAIEDGLRDLSWWPENEINLRLFVDPLRIDQRTMGLVVLLLSEMTTALKGRKSVSVEISLVD